MKKAFIVIGLAFGDEGKGATVDYLSSLHPVALNVRFNGGAQACHYVVTPDGRTHGFSQFGSGSFCGALTHLGPMMRVNPYALLAEAEHLIQLGETDILNRLTIDPRCLITTPYHIRHSEQMASVHRRGTCGMGVGETERYAQLYVDEGLYMKDLSDGKILKRKLENIARAYDMPELDGLESYYLRFAEQILMLTYGTIERNHETVIFEGAQGVMLDRRHGLKPFVTSSDTTTRHAESLMLDTDERETVRIGCTRIYATRHGVGTFRTENAMLKLPERHNTPNEYQGVMRLGWLDSGLLNRALDITGGVDGLAVSHLDYWNKLPSWTIRGHLGVNSRTTDIEAYLRFIELATNTPVIIRGAGETRKERDYERIRQSGN